MPITVTADHKRHPLVIQGVEVQAPHVFAEGHALTAGEAGFLNRAVVNRAGSALGQKVKKALDKANADRAEGTPEVSLDDHMKTLDLQTLFDEHFANFDFEATRGAGEGKASADPVARRAREIAEKQFRDLPKVKAAGVGKLMKAKRADGTSQWVYLVGQYLEQHQEIVELAKSQIEAERGLSGGVQPEEESYDFFDGVVAEEAPAAEAAAEPAAEATAGAGKKAAA